MAKANDSPKPTRKPIGKKVRFEVFKRDKFSCQYCGASAPEAVLHVDHVNPASKGGDNSLLNLITACQPCNFGKSDRKLSDQGVLKKQMQQVKHLQERREQLDMLLAWREGLSSIDDQAAKGVARAMEAHMPRSSVTDAGLTSIKAWIKKYGVSQVLDAVDACGHKAASSNENFFDSIPRYCSAKSMPPEQQRILYARGILRNRGYCNERLAISVMREAIDAGYDSESLADLAKESRSWSQFRKHLEDFVYGQG